MLELPNSGKSALKVFHFLITGFFFAYFQMFIKLYVHQYVSVLGTYLTLIFYIILLFKFSIYYLVKIQREKIRNSFALALTLNFTWIDFLTLIGLP